MRPLQQLITGVLHKNGLLEVFLQLEDFHLRLLNEPYLPLVIERHGDEISVTHWVQENGDWLRDPEVVLSFSKAAEALAPLYTGWVPVSVEVGRSGYPQPTLNFQDGKLTGFYRKRMTEAYSFCALWARNLREQGFARQYDPADMKSSTPAVKARLAGLVPQHP